MAWILLKRIKADHKPQALESIGQSSRVTRQRILQIEAKSLKKLKGSHGSVGQRHGLLLKLSRSIAK